MSKMNEKPKPNNSKKNCPIKCGQQHTNGSLFFCPQFRKKDVEERRAIQSKLYNVCIICLGWRGSKDHDCPVSSCTKCGSGHNILLCNSNKDLSDKTFRCEVINSDQDMTEDPEALVNEEKCYLIKRNREPPKRKTVEDQKEEVETALKSLSLKQPKTPGLRNSNDRVAFIQSGRVSDQILKLR